MTNTHCHPHKAHGVSGLILKIGEALVLRSLLLGATPAARAGWTGVGVECSWSTRLGGALSRWNPLGRWEG